MAGRDQAFGALVRREREARDIGLREMARMICASPTYVSKIERGELPPPAEEKVRGIAEIIDQDPDELLGKAGRVSADLVEIIREQPGEMAALIRSCQGLTVQDLASLTRRAQRIKKKKRENSIL